MKTFVAALFLILCTQGPLAAAQDSGAPQEEATEADAQDMEEITVLGEMNTTQLKRAVERARVDFWDAYNDVNEIDDFRMVCERTAPTGTNVKKLSCAPSYYLEASRKMTEQSLQNGGMGSRTSRSVANRLAKKKKKADAHMIALIEEHPSLLQKWNYLLEANETYEQSKISN